jgi:hypothetical protein
LGILLGAPGSSPAPEATLERGAPSNGSYTTELEDGNTIKIGCRGCPNNFTLLSIILSFALFYLHAIAIGLAWVGPGLTALFIQYVKMMPAAFYQASAIGAITPMVYLPIWL